MITKPCIECNGPCEPCQQKPPWDYSLEIQPVAPYIAYCNFTITKRHIQENNIMFLGLRTGMYHVADLQAAKKWYSEALGISPYFDEPFYVGFNVGGYELGLNPDLGNMHPGAGGSIIYWGVDNVQTEFDRLLTLGAKPHFQPEEVGGGIIHAAVIDPFGNILGIIYNPHFTLGK
jgi:predicted enzyme related to lactoylglutathione lyase